MLATIEGPIRLAVPENHQSQLIVVLLRLYPAPGSNQAQKAFQMNTCLIKLEAQELVERSSVTTKVTLQAHAFHLHCNKWLTGRRK